MPIPTSRAELVSRVRTTHAKLDETLGSLTAAHAELPCTERWTVTQLIAVRLWWTEITPTWIARGMDGSTFDLPEPGFRWSETPRLNQRTADANTHDLPTLQARLGQGVEEVMRAVDDLQDEQLLEAGRFAWAGHWPISRWVSVNTATQYVSARKLIRKAIREASPG